MSRTSWITTAVLGLVVLLLLVALILEAASGPTFRAQDHATYEACVRAIPTAWRPGSLERSGAEDACAYVHGRVPER